MDRSTITFFISLSALITIIVGWGNKIYALFSAGSIVLRVDIFISIALIAGYFYLYMKIINTAVELINKINETHKVIQKETEILIDNKIALINVSIVNINDKMNSMHEMISSMNANIITLAKK